MGIHSEAELNCKFCEFAKQMNIYLNHFPKHEKHGLAQYIRQAAYDVYGMIIEGQKRYHKKTTLTQLDVRHEQLRMYVSLAHELGYFCYRDNRLIIDSQLPNGLATHRFLVLSRMIDELGRMIGGWLKSERESS